MEKSRLLASEKRLGWSVGRVLFWPFWAFGDFGVERSWTNIELPNLILLLLLLLSLTPKQSLILSRSLCYSEVSLPSTLTTLYDIYFLVLLSVFLPFVSSFVSDVVTLPTGLVYLLRFFFFSN